jgi:hypothetical protein
VSQSGVWRPSIHSWWQYMPPTNWWLAYSSQLYAYKVRLVVLERVLSSRICQKRISLTHPSLNHPWIHHVERAGGKKINRNFAAKQGGSRTRDRVRRETKWVGKKDRGGCACERTCHWCNCSNCFDTRSFQAPRTNTHTWHTCHSIRHSLVCAAWSY